MSKLHMSPAFVLVVLAPLTGEVLLGSTPLSRFYLFPSLMAFYGSGALLIRELVYRRGFRWSRVVLLGIVYALIEEGLADQSLFNPHWPGAGSLLVYGRWLGVNWYWAEYLIGWHTVWSMTIPILLTSLLFPARRTTSWLRQGGLLTVGIIYGASCVSTFIIYVFLSGGFVASPISLICTVVLVIVLTGLALWVPPRSPSRAQAEQVRRSIGLGLLLLIIAFLVGLFWLVNHDYLLPFVPALSLVLVQLVLAVSMIVLITLISRWASSRSHWGDQHLLALASGALLAGTLAGIKIVQDGLLVDLLAQIVLCGLTMVALAIMNWRVFTRTSSPMTASIEEAEAIPSRFQE